MAAYRRVRQCAIDRDADVLSALMERGLVWLAAEPLMVKLVSVGPLESTGPYDRYALVLPQGALEPCVMPYSFLRSAPRRASR